MAGSRGESWWQPPKDFDARGQTEVEDPIVRADWDRDEPDEQDEPAPELEPVDDDFDDELDDEIDEDITDREDDDADPLEVELEDDGRTAPVGWTIPTGDLIVRDSGNRRFFVGVALILVATVVGVVFALGLGSGDGEGDSLEPSATTVPLDVRGATTIRPGGLSPLCQDEKARVQGAEEDYDRGSVNGQYTDMTGLVNSGKLAAPSTLFVVTNEVIGSPSMVAFAGTSAQEFEDYLVLPIPDGPCDTT